MTKDNNKGAELKSKEFKGEETKINEKAMSNVDYNIIKEKMDNNSQGNIHVYLESKNNKRWNKKNMINDKVDRNN